MGVHAHDALTREEIVLTAHRIGLSCVIKAFGVGLHCHRHMEVNREPSPTWGFPRRRTLRRGSRGGVRKIRHIFSIVSKGLPKRTEYRASFNVGVRLQLEFNQNRSSLLRHQVSTY